MWIGLNAPLSTSSTTLLCPQFRSCPIRSLPTTPRILKIRPNFNQTTIFSPNRISRPFPRWCSTAPTSQRHQCCPWTTSQSGLIVQPQIATLIPYIPQQRILTRAIFPPPFLSATFSPTDWPKKAPNVVLLCTLSECHLSPMQFVSCNLQYFYICWFFFSPACHAPYYSRYLFVLDQWTPLFISFYSSTPSFFYYVPKFPLYPRCSNFEHLYVRRFSCCTFYAP